MTLDHAIQLQGAEIEIQLRRFRMQRRMRRYREFLTISRGESATVEAERNAAYTLHASEPAGIQSPDKP